MRTNKFQRDILAKLLRGERVFAQKLDDGRVIMCDGYRAYMFYGDLYIDAEKCVKSSASLSVAFDKREDDELITPTGMIKSSGTRKLVEFQTENGKLIYIDEQFVKDLAGLKMYAYGPHDRVLCISDLGIPVAVVMPCRV